jgi:hypothetical protein
VAVLHGFFGYATPFDSEVISWDVAGATVSYDWYVRLSGVVQRRRPLVGRLGRGGCIPRYDLFGNAAPFDSEVSSWDIAGAKVTSSYDRHYHVTMRYSTAKLAHRTPQVQQLVMTGMFGYTASLTATSDRWASRCLFGYAALFGSKVSSWDVAGAAVKYDRHNMLQRVVQRRS